MPDEIDLDKLSDTGKRVSNLIELTKKTVTVEEIDEFLDYLGKLEAVGPILYPSEFSSIGFTNFDIAKSRMKLIKKILQLKSPNEMKGGF